MEGYSVTIREASRKLSVKEMLACKDFSNAVSIDSALGDNDSLIISPDWYAILDVHNEKSKNEKDYVKYLVTDKSGTKYTTGSNSFFTSFEDIFKTMQENAPEEDYSIECIRKPSRNYAGKSFITCSIV